MKLEWIGWLATVAFASSYFFKSPRLLRGVQGAAALLWIGYGLMIGATPVIAANVIVALAAVWSMWTSAKPVQ